MVRLDGSAGSRQLTGLSLASTLGLWSTLFTVTVLAGGVVALLGSLALALQLRSRRSRLTAPPAGS